jgi:hypothetical protein
MFGMVLPAWTQNTNRDQFEAQRKGFYAYTPFTAMGSPVVLPMDGKTTAADWTTGMDVNIAGMLFPHLHVDTAFGSSTTDQGNLQAGHHDPSKNGFTWQNIEFGLSGRFNQYIEAFGTYAANVSSDGRWSGIYEEWFGKLQNLPGGFELRGGRIYNRFGIQNTYHPHGFDWADQYLVNARMLGEDSMTIIGADVTWKLPVSWTSQIDVAVGVAPAGHGDHGHEGREVKGAEFEAEGAGFDGVVTVANWTNIYNYNDFHQYRAGASGAWGNNQYGRGTQVYGMHFEYQWRENGFETGGRYFRWRNEVMQRSWGAESGVLSGHDDEEHHDEKGRRETFHDFGFYSSVLYGFNSKFEAGLRAEYVAGDVLAGLDNRFRLSPGLTYYLNEARTLKFRVQYNYDRSNVFGTDHGIWGQLSFSWGGPEVR